MAIRDRTPALVRRPDPRFARIAAESKEYFNLIPHFTHLHTITLRSVSLPRDFYETLHGLHGTLRSVLVRGCRLTSPYPKTLDPADLIRLEELMFVQIAFDANLDRRLPSCSPRKLKSLLKLARAPNLRVLTLDRSVEAALPSLGPFLPATLHTVRLDFRGTSPPRRRPAVALFQFFSFLTMVRRLEMTEIHLSTEPEGGVGKYFRGHLMSLEELVAPMAYVHALFCEGRNIRRVSIVDAPAKNPPLIGFCNVSDVETALAHLGTGIEHVEFNLKQWDKEALYMLSIMAPRVRVIKIAFCVGGVDDDYFMTVGNMIEFPCLETLHLYRLGDSITLPQSPNKNKMDLHINGGVNKDRLEDQKEYMIIWQRHMPYLREVALCSDVVWVNSLALSAPPAGSDLSLPVSRLCLSKGKKKGVCGWEPRFVKGMEGVKGLVG
ncbi:hypothetical protein BD410DRAFT_793756 [Rickenella mellea]|uniref:F-box domain-containing protein n=1 Tax=Rickenella mellea TaxID=50990 RepID=A0A4Y7PT80_9AGAM|nr:hypothetical protein BD410DRAFT_793756 [Rickenella mellea]